MAEAPLSTGFRGSDWMHRKDLLLGVGVISIVAMLIVPLPTFLLDFLMIISIGIGLLTLLIVMFVPRAYDFSIFPTLLLVTTVFRLALNVSSTRLILLHGAAFDGKIVRTFGTFVVGGNYVIGFIIFIILVAVQFIVITKGATRTAEVAARFTLDSLPGKQMTIDSDFANGVITEEEANKRRSELRKETDFYGAMDGASKFVQGDVKVGILITFINILGGFIIGMAMRGETFDVASRTYSLLTIGDGLVGQIPSLLITTATGIIVTRSVSEGNLPEEIAKQFSAQPRALLIGAAALAASAMIPGFPKMSILVIAIALGALAIFLQRTQNDAADELKRTEAEKSGADKPESVVPYVSVDPLEVEIGYNLIPLVDPKQGGTLLDRITKIRRMSALNMGLIVPPIRIRDNMELAPESYSILIKGVDIGNGVLMVGKLMAMDSGDVIEKIEGQEFIEPTFGLSAIWIDAEKRDFAERNGYTVVDCPTIIATHLTEIIKRHADEILGRQEVQQLIDNIKNDYPAVVSDIMDKNKMSLSVVQRVLQNLLRERVSIRNLVTIFETLANYQEYTTDPSMLTEYVRAALARQICNDYSDGGVMFAITVDPELEGIIREGIHDDPVEGRVVGLDPQTHSMVMNALLESYKNCKQIGYMPLYLVSPHIRSVLFSLLEREVSDAIVLSYNEIISNINVNVVSSAMMQSATA
ncbi:MAG: flagellar biosynthesis protein FlhA [Spirochaetes bacterium]|jgi:flagellar biosynthesis protein FlhA|nr:flagellar biosynthesis protein FlhA [Spirochaetota bacterium]